MNDEQWVEVARYTGSDADTQANLLISHLESEDIEAKRIPIQTPATTMAGVFDQPIQVFVRPSDEDAAREIVQGGHESEE
ncbi:MAG: hypothetical protein ACLFWB_07875 [Armatimonadota bacterium]